jgi:threonine/homoserine/homoserine lactone efflux protein
VETSFFVRGLLMGLSIAATVGPISLLCIQRTLERGRVYGLLSGFGVALADGTYGAIAGFGLTLISQFLVSQQFWVRLLGGLFLVYLGGKTLFAKPAEKAVTIDSTDTRSLLGASLSTFFLTLTNPLTILSFVAIFAGLGLGAGNRSYASAGLLVLGVFLGSALWWFILTSAVGWLRTRLTGGVLRGMNVLSGMIVAAFGVLALVSLW